MWPWERKAYERGVADGQADAKQWIDIQLNETIDRERSSAKTALDKALDEQYRKLGQVLWEARRELSDDSPMHARIRAVLSDGRGTGDAQLDRIEKLFPGSVKRKQKA